MSKATYYELLGISAESNVVEINKAYRLGALRLHPDKNPDDPLANSKFHALSEAYAVLSDEKAKGLYDAKLRIEAEKLKRDSMYDAKRKSMKDALLSREKEAAKRYSKSYEQHRDEDEANIKAKFQAELDRIRKRQMTQEKAQFKQFYSRYAPEELEHGGPSRATEAKKEPADTIDQEIGAELSMRTLLLKWNKNHHITRDMIERNFGKYGNIDTINVMRSSENSALVLCSTCETALAIMNDTKSHWRQIYSASWAKESDSFTGKQDKKQAPSQERHIPLKRDAQGGGSYTAYVSPYASLPFEEYERLTFERLRAIQALQKGTRQ